MDCEALKTVCGLFVCPGQLSWTSPNSFLISSEVYALVANAAG